MILSPIAIAIILISIATIASVALSMLREGRRSRRYSTCRPVSYSIPGCYARPPISIAATRARYYNLLHKACLRYAWRARQNAELGNAELARLQARLATRYGASWARYVDGLKFEFESNPRLNGSAG